MEAFKGQKYEKLRKHHQDMGVPWTDPTFPPSDTSIGQSKRSRLPPRMKWMRPSEITENPKLFVDGLSHHDATQGLLGNCWFVAACSVLSGSRPMWTKVIPDADDQEFDGDQEYSGVFRFRFWRFGKWIEVLVDDLLPCSEDGELLFTHSAAKTEFWSALLEKAYAKLHGCYAVLDGGNLSDALVDFTSGVSEVLDFKTLSHSMRGDPDAKKDFFNTMQNELDDHSLMCCAIHPTNPDEAEERTDFGLVKGHAYGITAVKKIDLNDSKLFKMFMEKRHLFLVKLQNPWGKREWTGPFSDKSQGAGPSPSLHERERYSLPPPPSYYSNGFGHHRYSLMYSTSSLSRMLSRSPEWSNVSPRDRERLGLTLQDDGEFWMPLDDFLNQFSEMSICRVINTSLFTFAKTWHESTEFGSWTRGDGKMNRAGGCLNNIDTFLENPQFRFDVKGAEVDDTKELILQLSQRDTRSLTIEQKESLVIGFAILKIEINRKYRLHTFKSDDVVAKSDYIKTKHIFLRTSLPAGRYMIVATTFNPGETTDYLLRVFTEDEASLNLLRKDIPILKWYQCFSKPPILLTRITIKSASGLDKNLFGKPSPYCIVKCEGKKIVTPVATGTQDPAWNISAVFYRSDRDKPLKLTMWNKTLTIDGFIGQTKIEASEAKTEDAILELYGRRSKKEERVPGQVKVLIETSVDLQQF